METPKSPDIVPKGNVSQMDADIGKQMQIDAKKNKKKKTGPGPMGVTDIAKRKLKINLSPDIKTFLFLVLECAIVGFLLSIMMINFGFKPGIINYFGWVVSWWLIRFKMPEIIRSYRR